MKFLTVLVLFFLGSCAIVLAQEYTSRLGDKTYRLEELYYEDFTRELRDWVAEGDATVGLNAGWLEVDARSGSVGAATIWCKREFKGAQLVEYDVRLMGNSLQSNINFFLMASKPTGEPGILESSGSRSGKYGEYHQFPNYLITILNGVSLDRRAGLRFRMRLNPGFSLVYEGWFEPLAFGKVYHVSYLIQPPAVTVFLDGRKLGRAVYDKALDRGFHGLRIWHTHSVYDNFRVSRIVE